MVAPGSLSSPILSSGELADVGAGSSVGNLAGLFQAAVGGFGGPWQVTHVNLPWPLGDGCLLAGWRAALAVVRRSPLWQRGHGHDGGGGNATPLAARCTPAGAEMVSDRRFDCVVLLRLLQRCGLRLGAPLAGFGEAGRGNVAALFFIIFLMAVFSMAFSMGLPLIICLVALFISLIVCSPFMAGSPLGVLTTVAFC